MAEVIHADVSEAAVVDEPKQLPLDAAPGSGAATPATAPKDDAPAPESRRGQRDGGKRKKRKNVSAEEKRAAMRGKRGLNDVSRSSKVGRNHPCPYGSGKKYKKCCLRTAS